MIHVTDTVARRVPSSQPRLRIFLSRVAALPLDVDRLAGGDGADEAVGVGRLKVLPERAREEVGPGPRGGRPPSCGDLEVN